MLLLSKCNFAMNAVQYIHKNKKKLFLIAVSSLAAIFDGISFPDLIGSARLSFYVNQPSFYN